MAATNNAGAVFAAGPDRVTGAVLSAVKGTALPTTLAGVLDAAYADNGYISEDGLSLTQDISWEKIKEWGGNTVKRILSDFSGTFSWTFLETNDRTAKAVFGDANVTATAATSSTSSLLTILGNAEQSDSRSWVFRMKDGAKKIMIVVPDGAITDRGDVTFTKTGATTYPVTLEAFPDANGNSFTIYTDDGTFSGAAIVATGATAGIPGSFTPAGAVRPANLAAMTGKTATPATAWTIGSYVVLADGAICHWNATTWVQGSAAGVA